MNKSAKIAALAVSSLVICGGISCGLIKLAKSLPSRMHNIRILTLTSEEKEIERKQIDSLTTVFMNYTSNNFDLENRKYEVISHNATGIVEKVPGEESFIPGFYYKPSYFADFEVTKRTYEVGEEHKINSTMLNDMIASDFTEYPFLLDGDVLVEKPIEKVKNPKNG